MGWQRHSVRWLVVFTAAVGCAPAAPPYKIELPARKFAVSHAEFVSGIQIILEDDPAARVVASSIVVGAGAADDPPGQEGMAHLVEHLAFRSHGEAQPSLTARLANYGVGYWNAETSFDTTSYYQVGAPETLRRMVEVDLDRITDPLKGVTPEQFAIERSVVLNELRWRDESGEPSIIRSTLFHQLFPAQHPYARAVGGTAQSVSGLTLEQARAWVASHYRPRAMTWVVAGPLDRLRAAEMIDPLLPEEFRRVDRAPTRPSSFPKDSKLPQPPAELPTVVAPVSQPELRLGWVLPAPRGKLEPALMTLPSFVEAHIESIQGVEHVHSRVVPFENAAVLEAVVQLKSDAVPSKIVAKLREDWSPVWKARNRFGALLAELFFVQARTAALVALARENESILTRTHTRALRARTSHSAQTGSQQSDALVKVSFFDVQVAGLLYITGPAFRAVLVKPTTGSDSQSLEPLATAEVPTAFTPDSVREEPAAATVASFAHGPGLEGASTFRATNGLEVVLLPQGKTGLVTVTLGSRGGRRTSSPPGLADRLRWSKQSWDYGSPVFMGVAFRERWGDDSGSIEYRGSAGNLSNLLAMLSEHVLTRRVIDPPQNEPPPVSREPEVDAFDRRFWKIVLGDDAGPDRLSIPEAKALKGDAAQGWIDGVLDPRGSVLVIAGDVAPSAREEVEHWLARWQPRASPAIGVPPPRPPGPGALRVVKGTLPHAGQVRVRLACNATANNVEDELAFRMLASDLETQWNVLERENLGSSYGFISSVRANRDGSMRMLLAGRVENAASRQMVAAATRTWQGLGAPESTAKRLDRLRWDLAREFNVAFLTSNLLADAVAFERLHDRPVSSLDEVPRSLMQVTPQQLAQVGAQCQRSAVLGLLGESSGLDVDAQLPANRQLVPSDGK
jgi:zinc protease